MTHVISASRTPSPKMVTKAETILGSLGMGIKWQIMNSETPIQLTEVTASQYATMENLDILVKIPLDDSLRESFVEFHEHCLVSITIPKKFLEKLFEIRIMTFAGKGPYVYIYPSHDVNDVNTSEDGIIFTELINKCVGHRFTPLTPMPGIFYSQLYKIKTDNNIVQLTPNIREVAIIPPSNFHECTEEQLGKFKTNEKVEAPEDVSNYHLPPGFDFTSRPTKAVYGIPVTSEAMDSNHTYCFVIKRFGYTEDDGTNQGWIVEFDNYHKRFFDFKMVDGYLFCTGYKRRPTAAPETYMFPMTVFEKSVLMQTCQIEQNWGQVYQLVE